MGKRRLLPMAVNLGIYNISYPTFTASLPDSSVMQLEKWTNLASGDEIVAWVGCLLSSMALSQLDMWWLSGINSIDLYWRINDGYVYGTERWATNRNRLELYPLVFPWCRVVYIAISHALLRFVARLCVVSKCNWPVCCRWLLCLPGWSCQ